VFGQGKIPGMDMGERPGADRNLRSFELPGVIDLRGPASHTAARKSVFEAVNRILKSSF